jgi:phenylalanyl-tRNA synthetase beta subunit
VHLAFQSPDRTLTDADADAVRGRIVDALREQLGAELRG